MLVIKNHFKRYLQRQPWDFCWRIGLESTIIGIIIAAVLTVFGAPEREFPNWGIIEMFVVLVIIAPLLETLLLQALPIFVARKLKASFPVQIIFGTIVFGVCHIPEGFVAVIAAGIVGGFYFSFAYAHWRMKSRLQAFWVTAGSHAIHNFISFIALALMLILE